MKNLLTLILVAKIFLTQPDPTKEGKELIISLTNDNFDASVRINPHQKFAVLFMTKKSKHSKKVLPIYNKIAFDEQNKDIKFAQVDCKSQNDLCTLLRIRSYPTLYIIVGGKMYHYQQQAKEVQMKNFIEKEWMNKTGKNIPTKMPSLFEDTLHIITVFIEEGQKTFRSEGKYVWKFLYSILIILLVVIFVMLVYLGYAVYDFLRPVDYSQVPKKDQQINDKKLKKD